MSQGYAYDLHLESADLTGSASTQYFSNRALATGADYSPADTYLDGRIVDLTLPPRRLFGPRATRGGKPIGTGEVVLINADGALDGWVDRAFDGYSAKIYRTPVALHGDIAEATLVFTGTVEGVEVDEQRVVVRLRDVVHLLNRPVLTERYAGNNTLPNGLEGTSDDIKGRVKPWPLGIVKNWRPPCVNTSRLIYQVSVRQLGGAPNVFDAGVQLTEGKSITLAKMQAGATGPYACTFAASTTVTVTGHTFATKDLINFTTTGTLPAEINESTYYYARNTGAGTITVHTSAAEAQFGTYPINFSGAGTGTHDVAHNRTVAGKFDYADDATAGLYIRLGADPTGDVTVDVVEGAGAGSTSGQVQPAYSGGIAFTLAMQFYELRVLAGTLPSSGYYVRCLSECRLDSGFVIEDETTFVEMFDRLAESALSGWWFEAGLDSPMIINALAPPGGTPSGYTGFDVGEGDVIGTVRVGVADDDERGVPPWRASVRFQRNHLVQGTSEVPGATATRKAFVAKEYRINKSDDTDVQTIWPNAPEIDHITLLDDGGEAGDIADEMLARYARDSGEYVAHVVELTVPVSVVDGIEVLDVVTLTYPRFGYDAGKSLQVLGLQESINSAGVAVCELTLWG